MDVASVCSLPLHPPFPSYGKAKYSSRPSLIRVVPYKGCSLSYNRERATTSVNATSRRNFHSGKRHTDVQWCNHNGKWNPGRIHDMKLKRSNQWLRHIGVRSDLAGAATPESAFPKPELKLGSKIRGICFYTVTAIAAIFLFVLMVIGHPFVLLFDRYRRKFQHLIAKIWATISILPFYKIKIEGLENLPPPDTPAVYVSNHQSFLDIYTLLTLGRCFKFISKTGIFLYPIIGWAMFMLGVIPLKRMDTRSQMDCLKRCIDLVKKGASVFFFPEGTRSKDGKLGPFKRGAFTVASKTGALVVPITLMGTGEIMPTGCEGILNHGTVKVIIHKPIQGSKADVLCNEAMKVIADSLNLLS
ncbi:PREDICTED: 1-acyl-sn-glycerol-3-phosphate acyltransferase 1, chloroplastic [Tarenaya hassleriana]|uniref:1-acyl-sn-glycerol-3-phosphate acyltransferase 1, chloroplastic n=1 Tax=Tarenaya hassleriana TaxID=28532 RepID=UPI00053C243C|nr:PREDICTED: 1-acyl-sn-glycerol-3-phosphate acyltransferase 1, chloroplastic [Tarenaya hassleriana]